MYSKKELNETVNDAETKVEVSFSDKDQQIKLLAAIIVDYLIKNEILVQDE